jgi:hypothetical protein
LYFENIVSICLLEYSKYVLEVYMMSQNNKWYNLFIRWFCSTNAKDIGVMYLVFARWSGVIATTMS